MEIKEVTEREGLTAGEMRGKELDGKRNRKGEIQNELLLLVSNVWTIHSHVIAF